MADFRVLPVPNGPLADIFGHWHAGTRLDAAERIRVPTLLIAAEWDVDTPPAMARALFESLANAPQRSCIEIAQGTHSLMLEKNRDRLCDAVQAFLDDASRTERR